ncbi:MAG: hypothetical protein RLO52_22135 [Sandaracinaceae bacterium]
MGASAIAACGPLRSDEPRTGRHRRVFAKDLCAYRELRREESREAFEELAAASQDHDLGYRVWWRASAPSTTDDQSGGVEQVVRDALHGA